MEEAAVSYAEGVAKALVGKLGQLLSDEYQLLRSVRGGVVHLRDEVAIMNALLRMLSEAEQGSVNHFVREWMKQVREFNYDAEDCIDIFARRISSVPPGTGGIWHLFITLRARHRLACDIKDLRARALDISERRARYNVESQALPPSASFIASAGVVASSSSSMQTLQAAAANDPNQFVGIEEEVARLAAAVSKPDTKLKVFSIVGFGGLGKTTLAIEVCRSLEPQFVCQANVSVSQAFDASKDLEGLLRRILVQLLKVKRVEHKGMQEEESVGDLGAMDVETLTSTIKSFVMDKSGLACPSLLQQNHAVSQITPTLQLVNLAPPSCGKMAKNEDVMLKFCTK